MVYLCYEIHGVLGLMLFWDLSSPPIYFLLPQNCRALSLFFPNLWSIDTTRLEGICWIDFHWPNINISWLLLLHSCVLKQDYIVPCRAKGAAEEVEHPFLTKREMYSQDELDSGRFHHNAPTGSLPNSPTTTIVLYMYNFPV